MGGGHNFGCKAFWDANPDLSCITLDSLRISGTWVNPPCLRGVRAVPLPCAVQPGIRLTTGKMRKTSGRGSRKLTAGDIHYVDVVTSRHVVSIGLSIQVSLGTLGTPGLTLAQRKYLSSCRTNGFPTPDNFESVSRLEILCGRERMELPNHSWICLFPLYKGTLLAMRRHLDLIICSSWQEASGGRPDGAHVFHHRTDELLIQWDSVPDGEITYPVEKRAQNFQFLFSHLIGISRQSQPCIKVLSKIMGGIDPEFGSRWAKLVRGFGLRLLVLARASRC
jgi:hypothetical protein